MKSRVIPIILYDGTTVVKGTQFKSERTVGAVEATANLYAKRRPDEIFFLDVMATQGVRSPNFKIFEHFASKFDVPFAVGGGISSPEDAKRCIVNGAEKIVLGSSAYLNPGLISNIASQLGSQAIVVSVDYRSSDGKVYIKNGEFCTNKDVMEYVSELEGLGAGELLLQDISRDGTMNGLDLNLLNSILEITTVPIILSCGAGKPEHFLEAFKLGASGVAAGAMFQFTQFTPNQVSRYLKANGIDVRTQI